ncbi:MAG: FAD binding domain-containing protein [Pseudomonadota bacterium]
MLAYETPGDVADALKLMGGAGAVVIAGGTTNFGDIAEEPHKYSVVVDITKLGLRKIARDGGVISIGAAATMADLLGDPDLATLHGAARAVGGPALRNAATVGGNIIYGGDLVAALLALGADVVVSRADGASTGPLSAFYDGDAAQPHLVTEVRIDTNKKGKFGFYKLARRRDNARSVVAAGVAQDTSGRVQIGLVGVAPRPVVVEGPAGLMDAPQSAAELRGALDAALAQWEPPTDSHATAAYRRRMAPVAVARAVAG